MVHSVLHMFMQVLFLTGKMVIIARMYLTSESKKLRQITVVYHYCDLTQTLQPHYGNGVFGNVYLSAGQH